MNRQNPIAVFDSGMGGISVLKALVEVLPHENFLFFGDSLHAPYGIKSKEEVQELTMNWVHYFQEKKCKAIVIACNTATSATIEKIRNEVKEIPIIGIEPAVKPAVSYDYGKKRPRIIVLATQVTVNGEKYHQLVERFQDKAEIISIAAGKIVEFVENGKIDSEELHEYLTTLLQPYMKEEIDGIVTGCTHFPFVKKEIQKVVGPSVLFFDGAEGSARQTKRLLAEQGNLNDSQETGKIIFENSDTQGNHIELSKKLFQLSIEK